jgi:hypothetical protein
VWLKWQNTCLAIVRPWYNKGRKEAGKERERKDGGGEGGREEKAGRKKGERER